MKAISHFNEEASKCFLPGITPEEERHLLKESLVPVPKDALNLLRGANGQNAYGGPILGYSLLRHENIISLTSMMQATFSGYLILFEDGCGGYIAYREGEVCVHDDWNGLIHRFRDTQEMLDFTLESLKSGKYQLRQTLYPGLSSFDFVKSRTPNH